MTIYKGANNAARKALDEPATSLASSGAPGSPGSPARPGPRERARALVAWLAVECAAARWLVLSGIVFQVRHEPQRWLSPSS